MVFKRNKLILCLIALILLSLHTPLTLISRKAPSSFNTRMIKEESLLAPSGIQSPTSVYSSKKLLLLLKPVLKRLDSLLDPASTIACFICLLFIRAIINKRKITLEHCMVKLHGSKYKSIFLFFSY